jgi:hypothetical protein
MFLEQVTRETLCLILPGAVRRDFEVYTIKKMFETAHLVFEA